ncbi:2-dehydro-3-deoxy-6-phosphogalactonate aldolase [Biformimicrobium ophioploci]|uniref:2-dehydro-3-deoxy-6-phosphogalactonate aldolase n=1 Tax=Biformimicrobium ophioploci TaxID=3036711 RepID=A0ABQ6LVN3_9GAMM|nr:2-dehydro-3-deoxy-6-phosphogalactonate aldolase [Microbulbifer sp. NKW57]GMG86153.1 2-dehydro-3-deoxy-6-phosphogalactonate aldolase [Microbulbifer sp. NKW57]
MNGIVSGVPEENVPLIAILRGITPDEVIAVAAALVDSGWRYIEVPMNSPDALESIRRLAAEFGSGCTVGAGTVTDINQARAVQAADGRLLVSPNTDTEVIRYGIEMGMEVFPGVFSPTEAFQAIAAGAKTLKLFPAADLGPGYVKNLVAVLPSEVKIFAVGGVTLHNMAAFWQAGIAGFGIGGDLYRPGYQPARVSENARAFMAQMQQISTI